MDNTQECLIYMRRSTEVRENCKCKSVYLFALRE